MSQAPRCFLLLCVELCEKVPVADWQRRSSRGVCEHRHRAARVDVDLSATERHVFVDELRAVRLLCGVCARRFWPNSQRTSLPEARQSGCLLRLALWSQNTLGYRLAVQFSLASAIY